jgi:hypothetical protein
MDTTLRGTSLATEIRSRLSRMDAAERGKAVAHAVAAGDEATVPAILSGPAYLSGMSELEVEHARNGWVSRKFPDELSI